MMTLIVVVKAANTLSHSSNIKTVPVPLNGLNCICLHFACRSTYRWPDLG